MRSFLDYYYNVFSNPPESHTTFGDWSRTYWDVLISEGLIKSYPKESVIKSINEIKTDKFKFKITGNDEELIELLIYDINIDLEKLKKFIVNKLNVFGYVIGKTIPVNNNGVGKFLIEPKYPKIIPPDKLTNIPFYHITHKKYIDKIKKIGLSPRDSNTVFTHPGGRVYLIQTNNRNILDKMKIEISNHKNYFDKRKMSEYVDNWTPENFVELQAKIPPGVEVYNDPMFPRGNNHRAVFVTDNIPPSHIIF